MLTILCLLIRGQETTLLGIIIFLLIFPCIWMWVNSAELKFKKTLLFSLSYTLILLLLCYGAFLLLEIKTLQSFALVSKFNDHMTSLDKIGIGGMIQEAFQKTGRLDHWLQACRLTIESPIAGWGPGGFMRNLGNIYYRYKEPFSFFDNANNQYLQMSSDLGFLGAYLNLVLHLLPLLMIIGIHRNIRSKEERWAVGISFSIVSIMMILYMTGPHIMAPDVLFIMVIYLSFLIVTAFKFGFSFKHFNIKRYAVPMVLITALFSFESYNNAFGEKGYTLRQEAGWWPLKNHYGYYPLEKVNDQMMMWTAKESSNQRVARSNLLMIKGSAHSGNIDDSGLFFKLFINDIPVLEHHFYSPQEKAFYCYVPGIANKEIIIRTWVDKTFCPKDIGLNNDSRELGVMISPVSFLVDILPKDGIGFYNWETGGAPPSSDWPDNVPVRFRWTGLRASMDIENYTDRGFSFFLHAAHPNIQQFPVTVKITGDNKIIKEELCNNTAWKKVLITPEELKGSTSITFEVSRTWNPKLSGVSNDTRDLGIAVAIPEQWRIDLERTMLADLNHGSLHNQQDRSLLLNIIPNIQMAMDFSRIIKKEDVLYALSGLTGQKAKIQGAAILVDGPKKGSHALMISGKDDYDYTLVQCSPLEINTQEGSLSIWARLEDPLKKDSCLIAVRSQNINKIIRIDHNGSDGGLTVYYNDSEVGKSNISIKDTNWHHYVFTWKNGEQRFYIDSEEVLSCAKEASHDMATRLWIGGSQWTLNQWHGAVASFFTFNRTLTKAEINFLYRN